MVPKAKLQIAVRTLVEHVLRSGDLELVFIGTNRAVEGIRAHQKIQKSRPEGYIPEVTVCHEIETEQYMLVISGRIDGVYHTNGHVVIDEIKTTTRNLDWIGQNENPLHWGQVKAYAYLYAREHGLDEIEVQISYYQVETNETLELRRSLTQAELEIFFQDLVARYLEWADTIARWQRIRDASIASLEFPFAIYRPGQRRMAVDVYKAIRNNRQLVIQAATGIGKTMAAIFPSVKALGEQLTAKIFYLTARTTGRTVAEQALDELGNKGLRLKSLTLTAKDKICFDPHSACTADECEFARGHFDRVNHALKDLFQRDAFTRDAVEQTAAKHRVCPFEFSLELSLWADFIICDYNYAFDPRVYLRRFFLEENSDYTFLIDEAHNLVDRSREMFSAEISKQPFLDMRRAVRQKLPTAYKSMGKVNAWLVKIRKRCETEGAAFSDKQEPGDLYPLLRGFLKTAERWLALNIKAPYRQGLLDLYFTVSGFLKIAEQYDQSYATCIQQAGRDLKLKLFCIDPSAHLQQALQRCKAAVFFSATMTPVDYFKKILGCETTVRELVIGSPFAGQNLCVLISERISTLYRQRKQSMPQVTRALATLVNQKQGNYLLFFPSYEYMLMICESFQGVCPETEVIVQTPGMAESERDAFLEKFSRENYSTLVGFAVMGGIFGEGIDLVGDRLTGAAIVGVGLPGISPERELIREYFQQKKDAGFEYAYLFPGINRVLQAAGRVIRTELDRGVVFLIDQRFATYRYKSLFPREWRPFRVKDEGKLVTTLKQFWNGSNGAPDSDSAANGIH
jgi:DNA excision repair protein ERCC-2